MRTKVDLLKFMDLVAELQSFRRVARASVASARRKADRSKPPNCPSWEISGPRPRLFGQTSEPVNRSGFIWLSV